MRPRDQGPPGELTCGERQARQNTPHAQVVSRRTASLDTYGNGCARRSPRLSSSRSLGEEAEDSDSNRCPSPLPCDVGCTGPDFFNLPPAAFSVKLNVSSSRAFDSEDSEDSPPHQATADPRCRRPTDISPAVNGVKPAAAVDAATDGAPVVGAATIGSAAVGSTAVGASAVGAAAVSAAAAAVSEDAKQVMQRAAQLEALSPGSQTAVMGSRYEEREKEAEVEAKTTSANAAIWKPSLESGDTQQQQQQMDSRTAFMAQRKSVKELYGQPSWWGDDDVETAQPSHLGARLVVEKTNSADNIEQDKAPPSPRSTVAATPRRPAEAFTVDFGEHSVSANDRRGKRPPPPSAPAKPPPLRLVSRLKTENTTRQPRTPITGVSTPRRGLCSSARTTPQRELQPTRPATASAAARGRPAWGRAQQQPQSDQQITNQRRPVSARPAPAAAASRFPAPVLKRGLAGSASATRGAKGGSTRTAISSRKAPESLPRTGSPAPSSTTPSSRLLQRNRIPLRRSSTNSTFISNVKPTATVQPPAAVSSRFTSASSGRGQSVGQRAGIRGAAALTPTIRRLPQSVGAAERQTKPGAPEQQDIKAKAAATGATPITRPTRTLFNSLKKPTTVFPVASAPSAASGRHRESLTAQVSEASTAIPGAADSVAAYIMSFEDPKDYLFDQMFSGINLTHQCSTNNVFQAFDRGAAASKTAPNLVMMATKTEELNCGSGNGGGVQPPSEQRTGPVAMPSPPPQPSLPPPDEAPAEEANNIASNLANFGRTFTRKKLPSHQLADYWQNNLELHTAQPELKPAVDADVNAYATRPSNDTTCPEATASAETKPRTSSPTLDANLTQAVSVDSLAPSCTGTYILDVNDTLAAEGIPPVVIDQKAEEASGIANIMITSNTCTLPYRRSRTVSAGSRDSLDRGTVDDPEEAWKEEEEGDRNGGNIGVNEDQLKQAFPVNSEEVKECTNAPMEKRVFATSSEELELKTYGSGHNHNSSLSHRQSHSDYPDTTTSTTHQLPQSSKQRTESDRQSKRHQARADKSTKSGVSAFGKLIKNGQTIRERSSSNSITCSRTDAHRSVSSGFMDVAPETSLLTISDSEHERIRASPPTSYPGQCSCVPPPPYTPQDRQHLSILPDPDQLLRFSGARSNSCSSASPQLIDQLKEEFDQALADICYHSDNYAGYSGLAEYSNTTIQPTPSQCQTAAQRQQFDFPQHTRAYGYNPQNQQPLTQNFVEADLDYPHSSGYFTQGYACATETLQQPAEMVSPASEQHQQQHKSAFRPYDVCSPQPLVFVPPPAQPDIISMGFRQSSRARSPSRISPQAASLAAALRKRNSWDWQWAEYPGREGLRRHSSRSSVHSEIAGPSYMSSSSSAAVAAVWRSRRLRRQYEDQRQASAVGCQKQNAYAAASAGGPGALFQGNGVVGRATVTQYLPMRSALSAASLDRAILPQDSADILNDLARHAYNGLPSTNAVQCPIAPPIPAHQSLVRGNDPAPNRADTNFAGVRIAHERIPFADEVVTTGAAAGNNLAERPSVFTRLVTNSDSERPALTHTVLSRRVIPPPLNTSQPAAAVAAAPVDVQRLEKQKNASIESPSCGSWGPATPGVRGTALSSPLTRSAIVYADSSDSSSRLTYSPTSLSCMSDQVIQPGVRKTQRSLTKRFCARRHSLRNGSANTRYPRADSPTAEDITNNGYSPPYTGLLSKQRGPLGVSDSVTTAATTTSNYAPISANSAVSSPGTTGLGAGALSKLVIPTSTQASFNAVSGPAKNVAIGRKSRPLTLAGRRQQPVADAFPGLNSPKTDVYAATVNATSSQTGPDPAITLFSTNGARLGGCFDELGIQRPIAKRLDPEDHQLFALAYPQKFTSSSSSSVVGVGSQGESQPLLRCLGTEQRSNLAERSRRSISLGPTDQSPKEFYLDASGSSFRLSSTALADQPKESYETLLASSILHLSNRLRRCSNSLAQRIGATSGENSTYTLESGGLPTARTCPSSSTSPHQEGNDLLTNMREVEQHLQHMESLLFPLSKSGRTSVTGSCSETEYLQELERINSEISGFVPITAVKTDAEEPLTLTKTETCAAAAAAAISKRPLASTVHNQQWRPISMEEARAAKTAMGTTQYAENEHAGNAQEDPFLTEEYY